MGLVALRSYPRDVMSARVSLDNTEAEDLAEQAATEGRTAEH
jgi:hypothetical protein